MKVLMDEVKNCNAKYVGKVSIMYDNDRYSCLGIKVRLGTTLWSVESEQFWSSDLNFLSSVRFFYPLEHTLVLEEVCNITPSLDSAKTSPCVSNWPKGLGISARPPFKSQTCFGSGSDFVQTLNPHIVSAPYCPESGYAHAHFFRTSDIRPVGRPGVETKFDVH